MTVAPRAAKRARVDALTPAEIVVELDQHIIGQPAAKRALAVAIRNRHRTRQLTPEARRGIVPHNILMIGPTGVGKTEMVRTVAMMLEAPFIKVEATKFTEVGYVGRDVESIVHDLVEETVIRMHDRRLQELQGRAEQRANERLVDYIVAQAASGVLRSATGRAPVRVPVTVNAAPQPDAGTPPIVDESSRRRIGRLLRSQKLDEAIVEIEVLPEGEPYDPYWEWAPESAEAFREPPAGVPRPRPRARVVSVREAKRILAREEANKLVDFDAIVDDALERVEDNGIVFVDEIDKIAGRVSDGGSDVSGEGVQRDLLPIVEGSVVMTRYGPVSTRRLLFIAAGSFTRARPSDLIPELQGRFPLRVELQPLSLEDLEHILVEPQNALCRQYQALLGTEDVTLVFPPDGVHEMARVAWEVNEHVENIGARRLQTVIERTLEDISFRAPELANTTVTVDEAYVRERTSDLIEDPDLSRFIL